ncbi:MAG: aquaporin [Anaerotignum sp.]|nr:aquaporin [Anaerotignum sp.]
MNATKKYVAECIGTFVLTFFGCGTAVVTQCSTNNYPGYLLTAIAFGLSIVAMAYSIGNISGCHVNPAVSLGVLLSGKMSGKDFVGYVIAQVIGAIIAGAALSAILGADTGLGTNGLYNDNAGISLLIEGILTFVFVLAILGVTSKEGFQSVAGLVIGLSLTFVHILGIAFTGTSVNPARSIGPAIFAGGQALSSLWVFIAAPLVGAALAAVVYKYLSAE